MMAHIWGEACISDVCVISAGEIKLAHLVPVICKVLQKFLVDFLVGELERLFPFLWDGLMNMLRNMGGTAASLGINVGVASGSCATSWISDGADSVIQQIYVLIQVNGKAWLYTMLSTLATTVLNWIFDGLFNWVVKPVTEAVLEPIDEGIGMLWDMIKVCINDTCSYVAI